MLPTFLLQVATITGAIVLMEVSSPGFLPTLCKSPESVAECASSPFALVLVLLCGLFLLLQHFRRELMIARARAQREAQRKSEIAWDLMSTRNKFMHTAESVRIGRTFKPQPSDVFVVTYPKCGTTWVTQILHALRTGSSMDFGEITEVIPWDILAHDCGQDLDAPQVASPRVFKSHEMVSSVAAGARYIYVARNPLDAFLSFHKFLPAYTGLQAGDITYESFADAIFAGASHSGQIWEHMLGWWRRREDPNVLWVFFEDLVDDLPGSVARISAWLGLPRTDAQLARVCEVSSFAFMSADENKHHFDDHFVRGCIGPKMGLPPGEPVRVSKVRAGGGKTGSRSALPPAITKLLNDKWRTQFAPATGCADYEELRAAMAALPLFPAGAAAAVGPTRRAARSPARAVCSQ